MLESNANQGSILVVDDDPTFCAIMRELLSRNGYEVKRVYSVLEAIEELEQAIPDLILTDIMMPDVDGLSLIRALRSHEAWSRIPTVVVSARVLESDRVAAREAGADDFIGKPFTFKRLTSTIQPYLCAT